MENIKFNTTRESPFAILVKERVENYFKSKGISKYANGYMVFKIVFFLSGLAGSYFLLILGNYNLPITYLLFILLGLFTAFVGVNICHDAIHGAISANKYVNRAFGYLFNVAGANAYLWNITHNINHHTYTNIQDYDGDISSTPLVRLSPHSKRLYIHHYQHIYTFLLYGFTSLMWVFIKDYKMIGRKRIGIYRTLKHPLSEIIILIFSKAIYYSVFLILPLVLIDLAWWQILLGFVLMHFAEGVSLAIIIQLSHMVEGLQFPLPDLKGHMANGWAEHQIYTTSDYARTNPLVGFFFGGLNFHIEHHLFQRICHVHHKPLSEIVKVTAKECGMPYHDIPTLLGALRSHVRFLKGLGRAA